MKIREISSLDITLRDELNGSHDIYYIRRGGTSTSKLMANRKEIGKNMRDWRSRKSALKDSQKEKRGTL